MSPTLQKLRKDLDHAMARHALPGAAVQQPVGFDVIELLFVVIAAQDVEIRRLGGGIAGASDSGIANLGVSPARSDADAYMGHTESPAMSVVYQAKKPRPHAEPPVSNTG